MDSPAAIFKLLKGLATPKNDPNDLTVIDLQVGRQVHRKVPGHMRTELWLSVLHRKGIGAAYVAQYRSMLAKGVSAEVYSDIEKDVGRTFPGTPRFTSPEGQKALLNVLQAYAAYDEEVNYCQGMNFLAALMLTWLPREAEAFGALVLVMKDRGLRELYKSDMQMLQARLWQVGKLMPQRLSRHMEDHLAIPVLYASSWLLTAFASDFPIFFASRVMDIILTDRYVVAIMKVVVGILQRCEARLLEMTDMEKMVAFLKVEVPQWRHDTLQEVLTAALASEWTPKQALILERTENVESVVDAVQRVASQIPQGEAADDDGEDEAGPAKKESKLASFTWASKLSDATSSGASALQPGLLQSLTGTIAGLPSIISDAAHSVSSNMSSNLGDLLGLSEEKPQPTPADALPHQRSSSAAQQGTPRAEEGAGTGPDAVGEYLAALSVAASNSMGDAPGLVKRLNTHALDPAQMTGGGGKAPSHAVSLASANSGASSHSRDTAKVRSSSLHLQHSADTQHPSSADIRLDPFTATANGSAAAHSTGSFSPPLCTSPPSSPFKESQGARQPSVMAGQLQQNEGGPQRQCQTIQGRPSNLNRKSGGPLASRQSLAGPSDSYVSWGSFRSPEESRSALEPLQQEDDDLHQSLNSAGAVDGTDTHDSTDQAGYQGKASGQCVPQSEAAATAADKQNGSHQSKYGEAVLFLVDIAHLGGPRSEGSAAEDPFREAPNKDTPAAPEQDMCTNHRPQKKRSSLSHWEMQQLSGFAVSGDIDGATQAGPMRPRKDMEQPT